MGFFSDLFGGGSKKSSARYSPPPAAQYIPADQLFSDALGVIQRKFPHAYGAKEDAVSRLRTLEVGPEFYQKYQLFDPMTSLGPSSFQEALASQYFKNVMPGIERDIKHNLSLSGMAYSPIIADLISQRQGEIGVDVGKYLSDVAREKERYLTDLGQRRAELGLKGRESGILAGLNVDPIAMANPLFQGSMQQSNLQTAADYEAAVNRANADFQNALMAGGGGGTSGGGLIGSLVGGIGGLMLGGPAGAMVGSGIGGSVGSSFTGGSSPISFADALALSRFMPGKETVPSGATRYGRSAYGRRTPIPVNVGGEYRLFN